MRPLLSLAIALACMPALATDQLPAPSPAPVATPQPVAPVDVAVSGAFDVAADLGRTVYVEALASSHLTGAARCACLLGDRYANPRRAGLASPWDAGQGEP